MAILNLRRFAASRLDLLLFGFRGPSTKNETFRNLHGPRQEFPIPRFRFVFRMYPRHEAGGDGVFERR